jgi:hypothetical protein
MKRETIRETIAEAEAAAATPPGDNFVREAETLLTIAKILEPFAPEIRCRIMASACTNLGEYHYAHAFIEGAKREAEAKRDAEARGEGDRPAWEP